MANRQPVTDAAVDFDVSESASSAGSVARDFAALVVILDRQLERLSISDHETRAHISQAKAAAERGAQLSQDLLGRIASES